MVFGKDTYLLIDKRAASINILHQDQVKCGPRFGVAACSNNNIHYNIIAYIHHIRD